MIAQITCGLALVLLLYKKLAITDKAERKS